MDPSNSKPAPRGRARARGRSIVPSVGTTREATATPATTASSPSPSTSATVGTESPAGIEKLSIGGETSGASSSTVPDTLGYKITRPPGIESKQSQLAPTSTLLTNYFPTNIPDDWFVHQYAVDFDPPLEEEQTKQRKGILKTVAPQLDRSYLFDGLQLFTIRELPQCPMVLMTTDKFTNAPVKITIDCHKAFDRKSQVCVQVFNIFIRRCMELCKYVQMGRRYYDPKDEKLVSAFHLKVWPGFATSLRYNESALLLNVEMVCKVVRTKNVWEIIQDARNMNRDKPEELLRKIVAAEVEQRIVLTPHTNRTYPIEAILWDERPTDSFPMRDGTMKDYTSYYREKYGLNVANLNQPLLLVANKEKDERKGRAPKLTKLVPELCLPTGLTDSMRANFPLMIALGKIMHADPKSRVQSLTRFMKGFITNDMIKEEMERWGIKMIDPNPVKVPGKQLKEEKIYQRSKEFNYDKFAKAQNFRDLLHEPLSLNRWVVIMPSRFQADGNKFIKDIQTVGKGMGFTVAAPKVYALGPRLFGADYLNQIDNAMVETRENVDLVFVVLPNQKLELYSVIKQKLTKERGIPSQCCLSKNLTKSLSVATKIAVQMSCKVGGIPWVIRNPFKESVCVIGFDVYHSVGIGGTSYGAIVATTNMELSKSCSFISQHKHREEISKNMGTQVQKCLQEYQKVNGCLPSRIYFYRDGVGDGQVDIYVCGMEVKAVVDTINSMSKNGEVPKLTYVIVTKRINTRFVVDKGHGIYDNPPPGTIVDDIVTLHNRYDFFLVSQTTRQGTVSPTNYNVVYDDNCLAPQRMQTFTFKLCHNYYNWNGTLSVPSVCQNAHKLAYITGEAIKGGCTDNLRNVPYYL